MDNKLISVIIPVKNGEKYLDEAIKGIKNQNMNVEIIVIDDASTDATASISEKNGCMVLKHDICRGQVAGKNTGLKASSGEYIMFHDADDVMRKESLKKMYEELETNIDISAVMAKVKDFFSPELSDAEKNKTIIKEEPYFGLFTGAVLIRKSVFDKIGLFNEEINGGEIIEWQTKLTSHGMTIKKLDFISTDRRIHSSNFGKTQKEKEFKDYAAVLRARIQAKK